MQDIHFQEKEKNNSFQTLSTIPAACKRDQTTSLLPLWHSDGRELAGRPFHVQFLQQEHLSFYGVFFVCLFVSFFLSAHCVTIHDFQFTYEQMHVYVSVCIPWLCVSVSVASTFIFFFFFSPIGTEIPDFGGEMEKTSPSPPAFHFVCLYVA